VTITLPPLRERTDDIPTLTEHFLAKFNRQNSRHLSQVSPDAMEMLKHYVWPGNVRELENAMERAVVLADREATLLTPDLLPHTLHLSMQDPDPSS